MKIIIIVALLAIGLLCTYRLYGKTLTIGSAAPDFTLPDETGTPHTLSALRGSKVALYFYPKDFTPGCTKEACSIRDDFSQLKNKNIIIFGLSTDSTTSHKQFQKQYKLPFHLLSADTRVTKEYGVHGRLFTTRRTFLIDEKGIIVGIINDVDVEHHAQQIIDRFEKKEDPH